MSELALQKAVVQHLRLRQRPGVYWAAIPNGEARSARTGAKLKAMGVRAGAPDLLLLVDGAAYGVEFKAAKGTLSPEQRRTRIEWENAGGDYAVISSIDMALDYLVRRGAIYPDQSVSASKTIHEGEG